MSNRIVISVSVKEYQNSKLSRLASSRGSNKSKELRRILDLYFDSVVHQRDEVEERLSEIGDEVACREDELDEKVADMREELEDEIVGMRDEFEDEVAGLEEERSALEGRLEELDEVEEGDDVDSDLFEEALNTLKEDFVEGRLTEGDMHSFNPLRFWSDKLDLSEEELFERVQEEVEDD